MIDLKSDPKQRVLDEFWTDLQEVVFEFEERMEPEFLLSTLTSFYVSVVMDYGFNANQIKKNVGAVYRMIEGHLKEDEAEVDPQAN